MNDRKLIFEGYRGNPAKVEKVNIDGEDLYVYTDSNGTKRFYKNEYDILHRLNGPAVIRANGSKEWFVNGKMHREDGPAIENSNGYKCYVVNGNIHNLKGPAVVGANGETEYWVNGRELSKQDFYNLDVVKMNIKPDDRQQASDLLDV